MEKNIGKITKVYRHLKRYRQILRILVKYGFSEMISRVHLTRYLGKEGIYVRRKKSIEKLGRAERIRIVLEELGPTFIKLGHSIKDLGVKESFAIVLNKDTNKNIVEALIENFDRRWKQSSLL